MTKRTITLDGTKAGYARLKTLPELELYGIPLPDTATAPFQVHWDPAADAPAVCVRRTPIAFVQLGEARPTLSVRRDLDPAHDHALIRALRNAVNATDMLAKMKRSEGTQKSGLLTTTFVEFSVPMSLRELLRACLGAEILDPRIRTAYDGNTVEMQFFIGKTSHTVAFRSKQGQCYVIGNRYSTYYLREDAGLNLLQKGAQLFETRVPQASILADLTLISGQVEVDTGSISQAFMAQDQREALPHADHKVRVGAWSFDGSHDGSLRYNGVRIFNAHADFAPKHLFDADLAADVGRAGTQMHLRWMAECLGHRIEDFPKVSAVDIGKMIESTDFGYDF